ncbi:hypothetical protein SODALDRAFT_329014 [Sodiomyces alkalinus F11]|uniref:Cwf18 pre-mRNA splicing factor n=1 Tax=Sodiomyces alkalinus (strain CBS 110278 / VKM F-3762 / F11) TaxID=1314773 RepID=A0A3N2PMF8_SODAK|nr:hypothetical protein SODALDRAFT_329014 [Sodiomyces alkalinus F11]ROT35649.1 hypothetical protein SODALDRAFT_329014 [Sodiomyces alkalinus F11]
MSSIHLNLTAAADDRKSRLAQLKNLKRKQPSDEIVPPESARSPSPPAEPDVSKLHLSGRNYDPETRGPKLGFEAPPIEDLDQPTLEEQAAVVEAEVKQAAAEEERGDKAVDLFKLQPKQPNWDLKRDLEKKLEILNTRTDNAIARLVRERIANVQKEKNKTGSLEGGTDGQDASLLDGAALVEGVRVREREEEEDERRDREDEELGV